MRAGLQRRLWLPRVWDVLCCTLIIKHTHTLTHVFLRADSTKTNSHSHTKNYYAHERIQKMYAHSVNCFCRAVNAVLSRSHLRGTHTQTHKRTYTYTENRTLRLSEHNWCVFRLLICLRFVALRNERSNRRPAAEAASAAAAAAAARRNREGETMRTGMRRTASAHACGIVCCSCVVGHTQKRAS